ncbi:Clavaminate synthase-like protein [Hyaloscypha hepaticicola]|uniref:Clavaminate synthase-like protein n=1 Tax=Hyaloscypha hepaticicola TaxID=2082293 RepID=A0A2J6QAJ9_9HELO|nr:Clavaminate synthase-like protein [Hyaloscypha hepaticicola]
MAQPLCHPQHTAQRFDMEGFNSSTPQAKLTDTCLRVFCDSEKLAVLLNDGQQSDIALQACGTPIIKLLLHLSNAIKNREGNFDLAVQRLDDLINLATEKFYAFPFKDVPACWRDLFRRASFLKVSALAVKQTWLQEGGNSNLSLKDQHLSGQQMDEMVRTIDMALIMAGPPSSSDSQEQIKSVFDLLQEIYMDTIHDSKETPPNKRRKLDNAALWQDRFPTSKAFEPAVSSPIPKLNEPSFEEFENYMLRPRDDSLGPEPTIITGALKHWPARKDRPWKSPSYLLSKTIGGRRLVPIELGRSYVDEGWGQKIIAFKEFMDHYILHPNSSALAIGYLAQHDLFAQIPSLRDDITVPDYCYTSPPPPHHSSPLAEKHSELPQLDEPLLNAWFGPVGTISPLHTDPYHNILSQVAGRKYIRIYAPKESEKLYARGVEDGGVDMGNTSSLDIGILAGWDGSEEERTEARERFPLFQEAEFVDCILEEGECLYIPVGWWHYVRSLSVSFSVSFWFN